MRVRNWQDFVTDQEREALAAIDAQIEDCDALRAELAKRRNEIAKRCSMRRQRSDLKAWRAGKAERLRVATEAGA